MKRALAISVIVSVAVIMGIGAVAPLMTYVDARQPIPEQTCDALRDIPDPPPKLAEFIAEHCDVCAPPFCVDP